VSENPVVGHKTFQNADGSYRHEPLHKEEADALLAAVDAAEKDRAARMPDEKAAIHALFDAWLRLKELGWRDAVYCPKDGTPFQIIEAGSTGIFDAYYQGEWPDGYIISHDEHDSYVSRPSHTILFKPADEAASRPPKEST
jgi:hypothetical protein